MVDDQGIASRTLSKRPPNGLGELGFWVRHEQLHGHTVSSPFFSRPSSLLILKRKWGYRINQNWEIRHRTLVARSTHNTVRLLAIRLAPGAHHKGIIVSDDNEKIDAFGFDLVKVLDESREMANRAARCEGPCERERTMLSVNAFSLDGTFREAGQEMKRGLMLGGAPRGK